MYIKDTYTGNVRKYGTDQHDSLRISNDGTCLTYEHLQCGDGSIEGDKEHSGFLFCDDEGHTPEEDEVLCKHGADAFFNIGGWEEPPKWIPVSERLPEDGTYLVTVEGLVGEPITDKRSFAKDLNKVDDFDFPKHKCGWYDYDSEYGYWEATNVIAWMPLPEPFKAESEDKG